MKSILSNTEFEDHLFHFESVEGFSGISVIFERLKFGRQFVLVSWRAYIQRGLYSGGLYSGGLYSGFCNINLLKYFYHILGKGLIDDG